MPDEGTNVPAVSKPERKMAAAKCFSSPRHTEADRDNIQAVGQTNHENRKGKAQHADGLYAIQLSIPIWRATSSTDRKLVDALVW